MCAKIMQNFFCGYDSYLYLCSTKEGVERINKYLRIGTSAFCFGIMQKTVGMKEEIRNILDPASTLSEESVLGLLRHAKKKSSKVWDAALFLLRHNHPDLACSWLREQGDKKLNQLADVLPRLMEQLTPKNDPPPQTSIVINKNEQSVQQSYGKGSNCPIINL